MNDTKRKKGSVISDDITQSVYKSGIELKVDKSVYEECALCE